jgi:hypothetical protein
MRWNSYDVKLIFSAVAASKDREVNR